MNALKNFAIDKILRHVAVNPKLNAATNWLALVPVVLLAALNNQADWMSMVQCCAKPGSLAEVLRVGGLVASAGVLWLCGKWPGLAGWKPVADAIIAEAQKEISVAEPAGSNHGRAGIGRVGFLIMLAGLVLLLPAFVTWNGVLIYAASHLSADQVDFVFRISVRLMAGLFAGVLAVLGIDRVLLRGFQTWEELLNGNRCVAALYCTLFGSVAYFVVNVLR